MCVGWRARIKPSLQGSPRRILAWNFTPWTSAKEVRSIDKKWILRTKNHGNYLILCRSRSNTWKLITKMSLINKTLAWMGEAWSRGSAERHWPTNKISEEHPQQERWSRGSSERKADTTRQRWLLAVCSAKEEHLKEQQYERAACICLSRARYWALRGGPCPRVNVCVWLC